jgi:hypothetical protein
MNKNDTSGVRALARARRHLVLCPFLFIPMLSAASENRLGTSLLLQQDAVDNYLMSATNPQSLAGKYVIPQINYHHQSATQDFSINFRETIERHNRAIYSGNYPALDVSYKKMLEQSTIFIGYQGNIQSTRITEFVDSGKFELISSDRSLNSVHGVWKYKLDPRNSFSIKGSMQLVDYESKTYADLINTDIQTNWQREWSETTSLYAGLSVAEYESKFNSFFPIVPKLIGGFLFCPSNSTLISVETCSISEAGNIVSNSTSVSFQSGFIWNIHKQLRLSGGGGIANTSTLQHISIPALSVVYGEPINETILFGGKRVIESESKMRLANLNLAYQRETSSFELMVDSKIQPSSAGALWQSESVKILMRFAMSEVNWLSADISYSHLTAADENIISAAKNRNFFSGDLKYGHRLTDKFTATLSIGYRQQALTADSEMIAKALLGVLALSYTPREWAW